VKIQGDRKTGFLRKYPELTTAGTLNKGGNLLYPAKKKDLGGGVLARSTRSRRLGRLSLEGGEGSIPPSRD